MLPRLHPDMGIVPISARIARQLVLIQYKQHMQDSLTAGCCARLALHSLPLEVNPMLRLALHSLGVYLDLQWTSGQWLSAVLKASHFGSSFRRCFFFDYKDNRSPYPRVTNRGVQTSPKGRKSTLRSG